ncbi:DUF6344 domain-containing protein [Streptomyces sp. YU58]|uniref:DUF6344 domain-containing protein n=1 Tax=Streptomyces sp. SX92 TaxID=3158972 RepID=UPI0027B94B90|nr:DUF6344 domain-containing protein [Streptomyces coralus]WLW53684.1 DUF6344 domain-containing protein [Streptomyces coralus]
MARNKVMNLWTAVVTAFLALCTTLGLITTTAAAAVPQTETTRNSSAAATAPEPSAWSELYERWSHDRSLPPTMKQRIRAEAHGKTPSCRHRPTTDAEADAEAEDTAATDTPCTTEAEAEAHVEARADAAPAAP